MGDYHLNLEKPWAEVKEMLMEVNPALTEDDLRMDANGEEDMLKRVAAKLAKDVPAVKAWIESVSHNEGLAY
jgi:hypothetical protein